MLKNLIINIVCFFAGFGFGYFFDKIREEIRNYCKKNRNGKKKK